MKTTVLTYRFRHFPLYMAVDKRQDDGSWRQITTIAYGHTVDHQRTEAETREWLHNSAVTCSGISEKYKAEFVTEENNGQ